MLRVAFVTMVYRVLVVSHSFIHHLESFQLQNLRSGLYNLCFSDNSGAANSGMDIFPALRTPFHSPTTANGTWIFVSDKEIQVPFAGVGEHCTRVQNACADREVLTPPPPGKWKLIVKLSQICLGALLQAQMSFGPPSWKNFWICAWKCI